MWNFNLQLDRGSDGTLFRQVADAIARDVVRGRLRPGDRLPGTRTLAARLGVNRITVSAAYDELVAEGWVVSHPGRGSFVSGELPSSPSRYQKQPPALDRGADRPAYSLPATPASVSWLRPAPGVLAFRSSYPDTRLLRIEPLLRAYRRVLRRSGGTLLGYGDPQGLFKLRRAIAQMLRETRSLAVSADNILITRGSQMALALISRALIEDGDNVVVEEPGYPHAWNAFRQHGAKLVAMPVDDEGVDVQRVIEHAKRTPLRAVYVTPHHQLPTTVTLEAARRSALLDVARARGIIIVEDDYDHEFHFEGRPVAPLASVDPDVVIYVGTFSKILAPGLRLGYVVAPASVVRHLIPYRQALDMQGDPSMEAAVAELIEDDEVPRHVRRVKRIYERRRDVLVTSLRRRLGGALSFRVPAGGIGLWARAADDVDVDTWSLVAQRHGAAFLTGRAFMIGGEYHPYLRLGFACLNEDELQAAVEGLKAALPYARVAKARSGRS